MTDQVSKFLRHPFTNLSNVCEALYGSKSRTYTGKFSRLMRTGKFNPAELDRLEQIRQKFISEIS